MYTIEMFEEVFAEVAKEVGANEWYELFDSENFNLVEVRLVTLYGEEVLESEEYTAWVSEMAQEL